MEISNKIQEFSGETLGVCLVNLLQAAVKQVEERMEEDKLVKQMEGTTLNEKPKKPINSVQEAQQCIREFMGKHSLEQSDHNFHCIFFEFNGKKVTKRARWHRENPTIIYALVQFVDDNGVKTPTTDDALMFEKWFQINYRFCVHRTFQVNENFDELIGPGIPMDLIQTSYVSKQV